MKARGSSLELQLPDNSFHPDLSNLQAYFRHRQRLRRIAQFYRKTPLIVNDEQGLPSVRREILAGSH